MNMIKCELTGIEYEDKYMVKTLDSHNINFNTWKAITFDSRQGLLTIFECEHYYNINKLYRKVLYKYIDRIIKESNNSYTKAKVILKDYIEIENSYFEKYFNKPIGCTNKLEKISYFNKVINNTNMSNTTCKSASHSIFSDLIQIYDKYNVQLTMY